MIKLHIASFPVGNGSEQMRGRRSGSSGDTGVVDSNVLRKVASLALDRATIDKRVTKPKFVPEKLDFKIYEKFEGYSIKFICTHIFRSENLGSSLHGSVSHLSETFAGKRTLACCW